MTDETSDATDAEIARLRSERDFLLEQLQREREREGARLGKLDTLRCALSISWTMLWDARAAIKRGDARPGIEASISEWMDELEDVAKELIPRTERALSPKKETT